MNRIPRRIFCMYAVYKNVLINHSWHLPVRYGKIIPAFGFLSYFSKTNEIKSTNTLPKIISQADELFEEEKYLEVYDLLSTYKSDKNIEIQWRICRALYKMSRTDFYDKTTKIAMIQEAYNIINETVHLNEENAEVHKWMAIILDAKLRFEKKFSKIEDNIQIKNHLMQANKLNSNDYTVLYMLGQWHYKLCTLTWFQKKFVTMIYPESPDCKYEDALNYFLKAEELKPRFYLSNIYMLGKVNYQMGNMYRAHYYLTIAAQMTPSTDQEEEFVNSARSLVVKLKNYDISEDAL